MSDNLVLRDMQAQWHQEKSGLPTPLFIDVSGFSRPIVHTEALQLYTGIAADGYVHRLVQRDQESLATVRARTSIA